MQVERGIINLAGAKVQYSDEMKVTSAVSELAELLASYSSHFQFPREVQNMWVWPEGGATICSYDSL